MNLWPFTSRKPQTDADLLDLFGIGAPTAAGVPVSIEGALRVPTVAAAVRTIAEAAASLDVKVVEIGADGVERDRRDHPGQRLLSSEANDWTSSFELIRSLMVDALCRDAGGLGWVNWTNGQPVEIIRFQPGTIGVERDALTGEPSYRVNGQPTNRQAILHLQGPFDRAPVTLAREAIGVAMVMEKHAGRLFGHGARPSGVITSLKPIGDEGVKKMLAGWRAAHEGAENSAKTALLWDGATWSQTSLSSVDAQFQELRLFQLQEIARAFNVPSIIIGDLTRATWSNSAEMQRLFLMLCLEPWLKAMEGALRRCLFLREERQKLAVRFDRDDFSKVDLAALATAVNSLIASRVLNPNEGRSWLGMAPREGGNEFANPNTGSSQPGVSPGSGEKPPAPEDDDGTE